MLRQNDGSATEEDANGEWMQLAGQPQRTAKCQRWRRGRGGETL